jgi:adenylate kinase family enzyme
MKFLNVVLLGAPGVGKGTYANKLISLLRIPHISSGDLLRAEVAKKSSIGLAAQPIMISGNLVDSSVVQPLLRARLAQNDVVAANGCLLDGFPRNEQQARNISEVLPGKDVTMALHLSLRRDLLLRKITFRRGIFFESIVLPSLFGLSLVFPSQCSLGLQCAPLAPPATILRTSSKATSTCQRCCRKCRAFAITATPSSFNVPTIKSKRFANDWRRMTPPRLR